MVAMKGTIDTLLIFGVAGWELSSIADNHSYTLVDTEEHVEQQRQQAGLVWSGLRGTRQTEHGLFKNFTLGTRLPASIALRPTSDNFASQTLA